MIAITAEGRTGAMRLRLAGLTRPPPCGATAPRVWSRNGGENASHDDGEADPAASKAEPHTAQRTDGADRRAECSRVTSKGHVST